MTGSPDEPNDLVCHRCGAPLADTAGTLAYCSHCGAAQVWLSEELRDAAAAQALATADAANGTGPHDFADATGGSPTDVNWTGAIRSAGLAAGIAAGLTLLSLAIAPVLLLTWLWIIASPIVVLGIYHSRYPETRLTAAIGARIGLLTGCFVVVVMGIINVSALALSRHLHALGEFDTRLSAVMQQASAQAQMSAGSADNAFLQQMAVPEFRVGMLLAGVAMIVFLTLVLMTIGGAFAGMMRAKPTTAPRG